MREDVIPDSLPPLSRVLILGTTESICESLSRCLRLEGIEVRCCSQFGVISELPEGPLPDAILLFCGGVEGRVPSLIDEIQALPTPPPVLVLSEFPSLEEAVRYVRRGAYDYLGLPLDLPKLMSSLGASVEERQRARDPLHVRGSPLLGSSRPMQQLLSHIETACQSSAAVLVQGETGTGKELVARLIHDWSPRRNQEFLPVHCAALAEGLLESELFGHEKGAFTGAIQERKGRFELAHQGTLFLDELGEMGPSVQVKLLRVLETGTFERVGGSKTREVDVRLVSATHQDLEARIQEGLFREDLFYRLNVIPLRIPPLRERRQDIPVLAKSFLKKFREKYDKPLVGFTAEALQALGQYHWPGNVRELQAAVERAVIFSRGSRVGLRSLPPQITRVTSPEQASLELPVGISLKEAERRLVLRTLEVFDHNRSRAARALGISDRKIRYKMKEWQQG